MAIELFIPQLPKLPNQLLGAKWFVRASHAWKWKALVGDALQERWANGGRDKQLSRAHITFTRCSPRQCDFDGLVGSYKPVLDSLVFHRVISGDAPGDVELSYFWEKTPKKNQGVRIVIEPIA